MRKQAGPWQIIDDTYNANPLSMARMLDAAAELAHGEGRGCFIAVLGEMRELGGLAVQEHERLGRHLAEIRPCAVFWKGGQAEAVRAGLEQGGYTGPLFTPADAGEFCARLNGLEQGAGRGGLVLFKGSRSNALEEWLSALQDAAAGQRGM